MFWAALPIPNRRDASRRGFSLVESLAAISIMALAGGAIMMGLSAAIQTTEATLDTSIAMGIAKQLVDEVLGNRYAAVGAGPYQTQLTASQAELAGQGRELFNDSDDFNNFNAQPLEGVWGLELGQGNEAGGQRHPSFRLPTGYFADWREAIEVYYVDETDHSVRLTGSNTSNFRAVEVHIYRDNPDGTSRELASLRRVYAYVPAPQ